MESLSLRFLRRANVLIEDKSIDRATRQRIADFAVAVVLDLVSIEADESQHEPDDRDRRIANLEELLWSLYQGLYGHREAHGIPPFETAVEGALAVKSAFRELKDKTEPELRRRIAELEATVRGLS